MLPVSNNIQKEKNLQKDYPISLSLSAHVCIPKKSLLMCAFYSGAAGFRLLVLHYFIHRFGCVYVCVCVCDDGDGLVFA